MYKYTPLGSSTSVVAASQCGQDVLYQHLREMLSDFAVPQSAPTAIDEDNMAYIAMSENPVRRKHSRHIDIRRYFVRELVHAGILKLIPLRTFKMVADALTKILTLPPFSKHCAVMFGDTPFVSCAAHSLRVCGG